MSTGFLELRSLAKSFGALRVTSELSLLIRGGEAVGIIGPNGAGKTTLFSLIAGTIRADAGSILYRGRDITRLPAYSCNRIGIARSFQVPQPFAGMSVYENVLVAALFGGRLSRRAAGEHAQQVLIDTGLRRLGDRLAGELALLDRKRLELARALSTKPELLLLDEIAGGLTDHECVELVSLVRKINAKGVTIVWIEHVVHALTAVIGRLVVLDAGRIVADGEPKAVLGSKEVVQSYMGLPHV